MCCYSTHSQTQKLIYRDFLGGSKYSFSGRPFASMITLREVYIYIYSIYIYTSSVTLYNRYTKTWVVTEERMSNE